MCRELRNLGYARIARNGVYPLCLLLLAACGPFSEARQDFQVKAAQAADEALEIHVWGTCWAPSVGAVRRRFGVTIDSQAAYNDFCALSTPTSDLFPGAAP